MESFVNVLIFLASSILLCQCEDFMVMTYHSTVMDHYLEMSRHAERQTQKTFKRWHNDLKLSVCKKLIDSVSFYVLEEGEDPVYGPVSFSVDNLLSRLHYLYAIGDMDDVNYTVVAADIRRKRRDVTTHLCIADENYQAAIASAYHADVYFYLDKTEKMTGFQLRSVAEPKAFVHPIINYNYRWMITAYIDGLKEQIVEEEYPRSLCSLKQQRKFRLCSLAFVSLAEKEDEKLDRINYIRVGKGGSCVKRAKILIDVKGEFYYIVTDVLSCIVETATSTVYFYMTAHPRAKDSAYVLQKVETTPRSAPVLIGNFAGTNKYSVDFENVLAALRNIDRKFQRSTSKEEDEKGNNRASKDKKEERVPNYEADPFYDFKMVLKKLTPLLDF